MDTQSNIIDLALTGRYSYQEIGEKCNGVSRQYVHQVLKKNNIDVAWSKQKLKDDYEKRMYGEAVELVKQLYRSGVGRNKVKPAADQIGVPMRVVNRLWKKTKADDEANRKARLYAHTKRDENGCLIWQGNFGSNGQPRFNSNGHSLAMHHTYYYAFGDYPKPNRKRTCGNKKCVEPTHLGE